MAYPFRSAPPSYLATAQKNLAKPLAVAEDALARLDERLAKSPVAAAFHARTDIQDAAAGLYVEGELVHIEDLVLHDAAADIRAPSTALTRAHRVLRARRRIANAAPGWAASRHGLDTLRGKGAKPDIAPAPRDAIAIEEDAFAAELANIDALIARSSRSLAEQHRSYPARSDARDGDQIAGRQSSDVEAAEPRQDRLAAWWTLVDDTQADPPVLAAARAYAGFDELGLLPNTAWLGRLVAADLLRARGKTRYHLAALNLGHKLGRRDAPGRFPRETEARVAAAIVAITRAAEAGLADHDRWLTARRLLERKLVGRRTTSNLPQLIEFVMRFPMVTTRTIAEALEVSPRAAQNLVAELGLRELSGRTRYRCWGIL